MREISKLHCCFSKTFVANATEAVVIEICDLRIGLHGYSSELR